MKFLPVVPYVWASSPVALSKNVSGYVTSPLGPINEPYSHVSVK